MVFTFGLGEVYFRLTSDEPITTEDCHWIEDKSIGFINPPNKSCRYKTSEFDYKYSYNSDGHKDEETRLYDSACIVMALGDSHTLGVGVSNNDSWPNVVESILLERDQRDWQVINMGVAGYNLGQEYQMMNRYLDKYKPNHVILAFSMATDAYDIRTPSQGGFIYGSIYNRDYYNIVNGELKLIKSGNENINKNKIPDENLEPNIFSTWIIRIKKLLSKHSVFYTSVSRGKIGQIGTFVFRQFGVNLWPSAETVLSESLSPIDSKSWLLVEKLLAEFKRKLDEEQIDFTLVIIPYLPQVYDEVWNRAFMLDSARYNRFMGNERLSKICEEHGFDCIDVTQDLISEVNRTGDMLHYPRDAHPTVDGQKLIGQKVSDVLLNKLDLVCGKN